MRIKEPKSPPSNRYAPGCTPRVRDVHFNAALSDVNSPIVQRRSGKLRPLVQPSSAQMLLGEAFSFKVDRTRPADFLESGKAMARDLAVGLDAETRLTLARRFCASVIKSYWFDSQREYGAPWALPSHFQPRPNTDIEEPAASLADAMGRAAAHLDPIKASYLIGVTYAAMLPGDMRSRLGVYYTPHFVPCLRSSVWRRGISSTGGGKNRCRKSRAVSSAPRESDWGASSGVRNRSFFRLGLTGFSGGYVDEGLP